MDTQAFLQRITKERFFSNQITHVQSIPERDACFLDVQNGLHPVIEESLRSQGIEQLYSHQATAIDTIRAGKDVVIVTSTASGKTLCYTIPVLEMLLDEPSATMLFMYPTKALAQDQLRTFTKYQSEDLGIRFMAGTYDGDTPQNLRRKLRDGGNIILTNPDMLHQGILPQHARWNRFFTNLKYIVIDEIHAYRGVFGSHLGNVIRRLRRICQHYGANPQFICCSATIANPDQHAGNICGSNPVLINNDGSPRGPKHFVLWNPPALDVAATGQADHWRIGGNRRSPVRETVKLMTSLVREGIQTIAFVRTRLAAELVYKDCRDSLRKESKRLAESIQAYRGGYLAEERREIERRLANKEILGVASTNALELGIDIGSLDACILVGYPGTVASLWQQAGRAGRARDESLVFLVAQNAPMDQYLMANTNYLFEQHPEQAVVDPDNPHVLVGHLKCAANELPLTDEEAEGFGQFAIPVLELLEEDEVVRKLENHWYWATSEFPAATVNLRNIAGPVYTIQDETAGERVIGTMDEISALSQLHTHAVYLHGADTYFVNDLDFEQKIAFVEQRDLDYYTQSVQTSQITIDDTAMEDEWHFSKISYGDVSVTTTIPMFKKIKFHSRDSLGFEQLELPPQLLETVAFWFAPSEDIVKAMQQAGHIVGEALIGLANVLVEIAPFFVMCDSQDIGTVVDAKNLGVDTLFLHDRYPGGMGYARRILDNFEDIMLTANNVISQCGCEDGCPSCVGSAVPPSAMTDLDSAVRGRIANKAAAQFMLGMLFSV